MIEEMKQVYLEQKPIIMEIAATTKAQIVETVSTTKMPAAVAGGTFATTFTSSELAQLAATFVSLVYGAKLLVDIWSKITESTLKKRSQRIEIKSQEREMNNGAKNKP